MCSHSSILKRTTTLALCKSVVQRKEDQNYYVSNKTFQFTQEQFLLREGLSVLESVAAAYQSTAELTE